MLRDSYRVFLMLSLKPSVPYLHLEPITIGKTWPLLEKLDLIGKTWPLFSFHKIDSWKSECGCSSGSKPTGMCFSFGQSSTQLPPVTLQLSGSRRQWAQQFTRSYVILVLDPLWFHLYPSPCSTTVLFPCHTGLLCSADPRHIPALGPWFWLFLW